MNLERLFRAAVTALRERGVAFAVAGGFAASLYRKEPRLTMDIDLVLLSAPDIEDTAKSILESIGLRAGVARQADFDGGPLFALRRRNTAPVMIVGRAAGDEAGAGVDFLLPALPWADDAVRRAQGNALDFGFGPVPTLTLEDVILSKLHALSGARLRAKDLDDLQSIFDAGPAVDRPYLAGQIKRFGLDVRGEAAPFLPVWLSEIARDARRAATAGSRDHPRRPPHKPFG